MWVASGSRAALHATGFAVQSAESDRHFVQCWLEVSGHHQRLGFYLDGTFTSQFNTMPFQTVLGTLATNGFVSNTFAGQITLVAIPEPETLSFLLLGCGMITAATLLRRISRR